MNRTDVMNLQPGQDLDLLISEKVFNHSVDEWNVQFFKSNTSYSTQIRCAFLIVDLLRSEPWKFSVEILHVPTLNNLWRVSFGTLRPVVADTLPLAICRAALLIATFADESENKDSSPF